MVCLILHRASLSYSLDGENLTAHSWWGLGQKVSLRLRNLARAEVHYSFSSRLVGLGHLFLASSDPNEKSLVLVAQRKPEELADRLLALAQALMASPRPAADPKSSTPGEAA
jgi:hypothetical protein